MTLSCSPQTTQTCASYVSSQQLMLLAQSVLENDVLLIYNACTHISAFDIHYNCFSKIRLIFWGGPAGQSCDHCLRCMLACEGGSLWPSNLNKRKHHGAQKPVPHAKRVVDGT